MSSAGPGPPAAGGETRRRILDAASACFERYGVPKTTVEDVASEAGLSRATLYRYFAGGRDEIVVGVLARSAEANFDRLLEIVAAEPTFEAGIVEGMIAALRRIREDANLGLLFSADTVGYTTTLVGASATVYETMSRFMTPLLEAARSRGDVPANLDAEEASEWTVRVLLSLVTFRGPRERSDSELRSFLHQYFVPAFRVHRGPAAGGGM
ncbi:MAG: TetR/AcrR family transcriptional regulator [Acidimicrobiia bacterium]|nr:TetR/AcrR family transcriptional regulator [Acidimicrobiia bacterium]